MTNQQFLDLTREDVLAATNHHFSQASNNINITSLIHYGQVACMQPAITINGLGGLLRHIIVTSHHQKSPATEFATFSNSHDLACRRIDDFDIYMRIRYSH